MLLSQSILSYIKTPDEEQVVWDAIRAVHHKLCAYFSVRHSATESIEKLKKYIEKLVELEIELDKEQIFDSLLYAYQERNKKYPADFTMRLALEYMQNHHSVVSKTDNLRQKVEKSKMVYSNDQYRNKVLDIEKHLDRLQLVKNQLLKNLKQLETDSQHLWIDLEFINPALDTLKGSLAQVQDIEARMLVLKSTYQDYQD